MSILIRGMDMPTNCKECRLTYDSSWCLLLDEPNERVKGGLMWKRCAETGRLEDCPLVTVPPHGHWRGEYDGYADGNPCYDMWYCSECDYYVEDDSYPEYKYCPNCGAKMDGDGDV